MTAREGSSDLKRPPFGRQPSQRQPPCWAICEFFLQTCRQGDISIRPEHKGLPSWSKVKVDFTSVHQSVFSSRIHLHPCRRSSIPVLSPLSANVTLFSPVYADAFRPFTISNACSPVVVWEFDIVVISLLFFCYATQCVYFVHFFVPCHFVILFFSCPCNRLQGSRRAEPPAYKRRPRCPGRTPGEARHGSGRKTRRGESKAEGGADM